MGRPRATSAARGHRRWLLHQILRCSNLYVIDIGSGSASARSTQSAPASAQSADRYVTMSDLMLYVCMLVLTSMLGVCMMFPVIVVMIYIWNKFRKLSNLLTIQKPCCRPFPEFTVAHLADALRPETKFSGVHFKRWQVKVNLWLNATGVFWASNGKPEGNLTADELKRFTDANTMFVGAVLGALSERLCDVYMHIAYAKELWDALNAKFGASDTGSELYVMENFHDIKMVDNRSVVEQAHEIQCIVKEQSS